VQKPAKLSDIVNEKSGPPAWKQLPTCYQVSETNVNSHTWQISKDSKPGVFTVSALASATGYKSLIIRTKATFNVSPAVVQTWFHNNTGLSTAGFSS
jgi:hypothetical protein